MYQYEARRASHIASRLHVRGALALAATLAWGLMGPIEALAQQPGQPKGGAKTQSKPSTTPAQPTRPPQSQVPARSDQDMPVVYSPWTKLCQKEQTPTGEKTICTTQMAARLETGQTLAAAMLIEVQGEATKLIRAMLPLGILLPQGARVVVDKDEPIGAPYLMCVPDGCLAQRDVNAEFVARLKKGQTLVLQGMNPAGQIATYQLPLANFAKANDGPPTTPEDLDRDRKKFEDELKRRGRERMESPPQGDGGR